MTCSLDPLLLGTEDLDEEELLKRAIAMSLEGENEEKKNGNNVTNLHGSLIMYLSLIFKQLEPLWIGTQAFTW